MSGIDLNVGWKIHFDPINESDNTLAAIDEFVRGTGHKFKRVGLPGGGERGGKYYTAYPQSLEARDELINSLEEFHSRKNLLAEIGPDFQLEANTKVTPRISSRFTTGYSKFDPKTGLPLFDKSTTAPNEAFASDAAQKIGKINHYIKDSWTSTGAHTQTTKSFGLRVTAEELAEDTDLLKKNYPEVHELLVGKPGYQSPYPGIQSSAPIKFNPIETQPKPVTKRVGPTPPESGTTLKNVGEEPAQTRLRGKAIKEYEKVYPAPNQSHEATMADIENIKKQRQKSAEAAVTAEQNAREKAERKVKRRTERKTKAEAAREAREGRLRHGEPTDLPTETKPIVPKVDDVVPKAAAETAAETAPKSPPIPSPADSTRRASNTTKKIAESLDAAKKAVKGHTNARGLLLAGAASIVGVGLYQRNRQTRIEPDEDYH